MLEKCSTNLIESLSHKEYVVWSMVLSDWSIALFGYMTLWVVIKLNLSKFQCITEWAFI